MKKIPRLKSARFADGWRSRVVYIADGKHVRSWSVFTSPDGTEYTPTFPRERPALVSVKADLAKLYITRWEGSAAQRRWKKANARPTRRR